MKFKYSIKLALFTFLLSLVSSISAFSFQENNDSILKILDNIKILDISDIELSKIKNKDLNLRIDVHLDSYIYEEANFIIGIDSISRNTVFLRYFLDKTKYFDTIIRYLSSISDYEILSEEPEFYIWKNKEERYFVLQLSKDTCIFTELVLGYFLKYYAKYLE